MKTLLILIVCWLISGQALAQSERFDTTVNSDSYQIYTLIAQTIFKRSDIKHRFVCPPEDPRLNLPLVYEPTDSIRILDPDSYEEVTMSTEAYLSLRRAALPREIEIYIKDSINWQKRIKDPRKLILLQEYSIRDERWRGTIDARNPDFQPYVDLLQKLYAPAQLDPDHITALRDSIRLENKDSEHSFHHACYAGDLVFSRTVMDDKHTRAAVACYFHFHISDSLDRKNPPFECMGHSASGFDFITFFEKKDGIWWRVGGFGLGEE
jgi:hypothetical protein